MAFSLHHALVVVLLVFLLNYNPTTSSHHHSELKSLHFSLYQHETVNKTGYVIVNGVTGGGITQTTMPFGTIYAFQDVLTDKPEPTSKAVGISEGTSITSSLDGLRSISVAKVSLSLKNHKGSLSILGVTHNTKPAELPVVGGTGDFMFVQGHVTSSPVDLKGLTVVYKIEFHLYWPPYATKTSS